MLMNKAKLTPRLNIWTSGVGLCISEVCDGQVILNHLCLETAVQKDFSQKSIFTREITFEK